MSDGRSIRVLLVQPDPQDGAAFEAALRRRPEVAEVYRASSVDEALGALFRPTVVLADSTLEDGELERLTALAGIADRVVRLRPLGQGRDAAATASTAAAAVERALRDSRLSEVAALGASLVQSERRLRLLVDNALDIFAIVDGQGVTRYQSPAVQRVLGYAPDELVGSSPLDIVHPDDQPAAAQMVLDAFQRPGATKMLEYRARHKDGGWRYLESMGRVVVDDDGSLIGIINSRDVTERRIAESRGRITAEILEASFNEVYMVSVETRRFLHVNPRACENLGYTAEELRERAVEEVASEVTADVLDELGQDPRSDEPRTVRLSGVHLRKDGSSYPVEAQVHKAWIETGPAFVLIAIDISERQKALEAVRESRAKSALLSNMNHELRTPLNAILGFARVLQKQRFGALSEQQSSFVRDIVHGAEHMLSLVDDLLDFRRLEEGGEQLRPQTVDVRAVADEASRLVAPLAEQKGIAVSIVAVGGGDLPRLTTDRRALVQILVNLLSNAVKYTDAAGRVEVRFAVAGEERLRVEVEDTGIGIDPAHLRHLFTYWQQVGGKHAYNLKGSGIGLALTRALVRRLGGEIDVRSEVGRGSVFGFTLPVTLPSGRGAPPEGESGRWAQVTVEP